MSGKNRERPRQAKLKQGQATWAGLVNAIKREVLSRKKDLDGLGGRQRLDDPGFAIIVGWCLAKGMTPRESFVFADFIWDETDLI